MTERSTPTATLDVAAVSARIEERLAEGVWQQRSLVRPAAGLAARAATCEAAAEIGTFALALSGRRRTARRGGRLSQLVRHFAFAATLALTGVVAACDKPDAAPQETAVAVQQLPTSPGAAALITATPSGSAARYTDLMLVDPGGASAPWAVMVPTSGGSAPVLVDAQAAGLDTAGAVYTLPALAIPVGTRDGPTQFLAPQAPAERTADGSGQDVTDVKSTVVSPWRQDERYAAATRAIAGQLTLLDAAYNAPAAVQAGGTHTYADGVVLRADAEHSSLQVIDRTLLESTKPTRPEDTVFVAIRPEEQALYQPGQVVTLRDVIMTRQDAAVDGQNTTFYIANAALQGARVEPTGNVDLQGILNQRLQLTDAQLATQVQALATSGATPSATGTPAAAAPQQPIIVERQGGGPSFIEDFLIWTWLTQPRYYGGSGVTIVNPPASPSRPGGGDYYYTQPSTAPRLAPAPTGDAARGTAIQAARNAVSGQASGTGGGVAATSKAAAESSARVSAATAKGAAAAGEVSAASAGKSTASVPSSGSATASRSVGRSGAASGSAVGSSGTGSSGRSTSGASRGGGFGGTGSSSSSSA